MGEFKEMVLSDVEKAAYRLGARKISGMAKDGLVLLLKKFNMQKRHINAFLSVADTDIGHGAIAYMLGFLLPKAPGMENNPKIMRLCQEFRIEGMAIGGEAVLDSMIEVIAPGLSSFLTSLPAENTTSTKTRLSVPSTEEAEELEEAAGFAKTFASGTGR